MTINIQKYIKYLVLSGMPILLLAGCTELDEKSILADREVRSELPTEEFKDARIIHTDEGDTSFVLNSPQIYRHSNTNSAELEGGIKVDFYKSGKVSSVLTADRGEVLRDGRELHGVGNVVVTTDTGMVIYTEKLRWTERDHMIRSDTTTTIIQESDTLIGTGLISTDDLKYRRLFNPRGVSRRGKEKESTINNLPETMPDSTVSDSLEDEYESEMTNSDSSVTESVVTDSMINNDAAADTSGQSK